MTKARELTDRERSSIDFERTWWTFSDRSKAAAIREQLGVSPSTYYALLDSLIDCAEAERYDPLVVRRLRRKRTDRRRMRFEPEFPQQHHPH